LTGRTGLFSELNGMKKVVALSASPRRGGNSEILLDQALSEIKNAGGEAEKIILSELNIAPCGACSACEKTGLCTVEDDFQKIYRFLKDENLFLVAFPVFFNGVPAQLKALVDRCQCCWQAKYRLKNPIAPASPQRRLSVIGVKARPDMEEFAHSLASLKVFALVNNLEYHQELLVDQLEEAGTVYARPEALLKARELGKNLVL